MAFAKLPNAIMNSNDKLTPTYYKAKWKLSSSKGHLCNAKKKQYVTNQGKSETGKLLPSNKKDSQVVFIKKTSLLQT